MFSDDWVGILEVCSECVPDEHTVCAESATDEDDLISACEISVLIEASGRFVGEPGWVRTIDPLIKSQMLCH
jgi:hypothetical protein